jgi:hypothetical protein
VNTRKGPTGPGGVGTELVELPVTVGLVSGVDEGGPTVLGGGVAGAVV